MSVGVVSKCLICAYDFVSGCVLIINLRYNDYMDANIEYAMLYLELNVFSLILIWIILRKSFTGMDQNHHKYHQKRHQEE